MAGGIVYGALHQSAAFREQMQKAQAEYIEKTSGQTVEVNKVEATQAPTIYIYNIDGTPTTEKTRGIKVEKGRKYATQ